MSHSRTRSLVLAAAVMAAAFAPAAVAGAAAPAKGDTARAEHDRIVAYWTPERMKAAKPRDFVRNADGSFSLAATPKGKPTGENRGKPGGGGTDPAPTPLYPDPGTSTGDAWTGGGSVDARTGKVFFTSGMWGYVCSGAVVADGVLDRALVLTAGHCVYDNEKKGKKPAPGFVSNWLFVPDYQPTGFLSRCSAAEQPCWTAEALVVHEGFANAGGFNATATKYDFAFAVVSSPDDGELDAVVGSYSLGFEGATSTDDRLAAFGYPAASPYDGNQLTYCEGPVGQDSRNSNATWSMACDMTGGSSGGPWLKGMAANAAHDLTTGDGGTVNSLNSYGYTGEPYMYGPKFNGNTKDVYDEAVRQAGSASPGNATVPVPTP